MLWSDTDSKRLHGKGLGFTSTTATLWITLPISAALSIIFGAAFYEALNVASSIHIS